MASMTMTDAVLCLALALRIHGTEAAVIATAHRVRGQVRREIQPIIGRVIRCRSPKLFVENFLREYQP